MKFIDERNKILRINEEYFGHDKSQNYIKHDFRRALEGFVQREVLLHVMIESSKKRHDKQETLDESGKVTSVSHGDFDPDNAGFLYSVFKNHELGSMLDLRLLLTKNESGTGGSFVKDLLQLETDDFMHFYLHKKPDSTSIPPFLSKSFFESKGKEQIKGYDFIMNHKSDIDTAVRQLKLMAKQFNDSNYKDKIVTNYEALKFHKNRQPTKYEVSEVADSIGPLKFAKTTRKDISKVETKLITKALNEFAEIVEVYRLISGGVEGLHGSSWSLETYVKRTFQVFRMDVSTEIQDSVIKNLEKHLLKSFNLSFWSIR